MAGIESTGAVTDNDSIGRKTVRPDAAAS